jgi:hypothetical protein
MASGGEARGTRILKHAHEKTPDGCDGAGGQNLLAIPPPQSLLDRHATPRQGQLQNAEPVQWAEDRVRVFESCASGRSDRLGVMAAAHKINCDQAAPVLQPDMPGRMADALQIGAQSASPRITSGKVGVVDVDRDHGAGALNGEVKRGLGEEITLPHRLLLGIPGRLDGGWTHDWRYSWCQTGQFGAHVGAGLKQTRRAHGSADQTHGRSLLLAWFGSDLDREVFTLARRATRTERQKGRTTRGTEVKESRAEPGFGLNHTTDRAGA